MMKKKTSKKKTKEKSPAQKAADTVRKRKLHEALGIEKPTIERPAVKITPYPRAGDNKEFEGVLDRVGLEQESSPGSKPATPPTPAKAPGPASGDEILTVADVAEWVAWPFMAWAQMNKLPGLALSTKEARSVAEPLTSILNRHGASRFLPPDVFDGVIAAARLTPIMGDRFEAVKKERDRRAAAGGAAAAATSTAPGPGPVKTKVHQGAAATKPREV